MKNNKGFSIVASLLVVLIILVLGFGIYFATKNSASKNEVNNNSNYSPTEQDYIPPTKNSGQVTRQTPSPQTHQQTNNVVSTANWKIYTNTECGYSFQYPNSWSQGKESNAINLQNTIMSRMVDFIDTASQGIETQDGKNNQLYAPKDNMHIKCYTMGSAVYSDELSRYNNSSDIFSQIKKTITVGGQTAIVGEIRNTATVSSGEHAGRTVIPSHNMHVFFMHKDHAHSFYFEFDTPLNVNDATEIANFEELLKTFKFN